MICAIALLAIFLTAAEIWFSNHFGLLSNPPINDGVSLYMQESKRILLQLKNGNGTAAPTSVIYELIYSRYPLWMALLLLSQAIFGVGEWQSYTIRFWPTFLLLLLMFWVLRRRGGTILGWAAVLVTALLPILSVSLRAILFHSLSNHLPNGMLFGSSTDERFYIADQRPNVFCYVLLLWALVPVIEKGRHLTRATWLWAGAFLVLAILAKATYTPMILMMVGLTYLYLLLINRKKIRSTVLTSFWVLFPFVLMSPWLFLGGLSNTISYIYVSIFVEGPKWSNLNRTFASEFSHYWILFSVHMGIEGWLFLGGGLLSFGIAWFKLRRVDDRLLVYLGLASIYFLFVATSAVKDQFSGTLYYLLLWIFSWLALVPVFLWVSQRYKMMPLIVAGSYFIAIVVGVSYMYSSYWLPEYQEAGIQNRASVAQVGADLQQMLTPEDCYMVSDDTNYGSMRYYMLSKQGLIPYAKFFDGIISIPSDTAINDYIKKMAQCKVVLAFDEPVSILQSYLYIHPFHAPVYQAVQNWVRQPNNPYRPIKAYPLIYDRYSGGVRDRRTLTLRLYRRT
ncbi:hypothetical protein JOY44_04280 [Phormidium sp. CLA17]|uniref:hypothetical protein n=1 Tax=Leptolyngbya sp. Cla-17 TaxID=2803751 RepID=UPI0019338C05|nr:hypothetical protein [Leptolyngbya sp. Cla-17]MBM0740840.1 hypothetical protein [Leptolyngbya sp. Cla-17]